jgi:hypothetical protein
VLLSTDAGPVSDVDLWNSIIRLRAQAGATQQWVALAAGMPLDSIDSDYNLLWHPDALATGKHFSYGGIAVDLATWRSYGRDQDRADPLGSHRADPQFVTNPQANDYHTVPGSLARDGALGNTGSPFRGATQRRRCRHITPRKSRPRPHPSRHESALRCAGCLARRRVVPS